MYRDFPDISVLYRSRTAFLGVQRCALPGQRLHFSPLSLEDSISCLGGLEFLGQFLEFQSSIARGQHFLVEPVVDGWDGNIISVLYRSRTAFLAHANG